MAHSAVPGHERQTQLRELLESRHIRVTSQRLALLVELSRGGEALSHPELAERLVPNGLDRATVYRNLLALAQVGILLRTRLGDGVWRYQLVPTGAEGHNAHPHLVCVDCGAVRCLPGSDVSLHGEAARAQVVDIQLRGRCAACSVVPHKA